MVQWPRRASMSEARSWRDTPPCVVDTAAVWAPGGEAGEREDYRLQGSGHQAGSSVTMGTREGARPSLPLW